MGCKEVELGVAGVEGWAGRADGGSRGSRDKLLQCQGWHPTCLSLAILWLSAGKSDKLGSRYY